MELVSVADLGTDPSAPEMEGESGQAHDLGVLAVLEIVRLQEVIVVPGVSGVRPHA